MGAHAFLAYGNALGVAWRDLGRTQDIDFAHAGRNVSLALPSGLNVDTRDAIASLEAGFLPVPGFRPWNKTGSFVSKVDKQLRVDFLTPLVGGKGDVYEHVQLGVNLQPLRFLEFIQILQTIFVFIDPDILSISGIYCNVGDFFFCNPF